MTHKISFEWPVALAAALLVLAGCQKVEEKDVRDAQAVSFKVSTGSGRETRTSFSGRDENNELMGSTSQWERIDWTEGDLFRLYSAEAATLGGEHFSDYTVSSATPDGQNSLATVSTTSPLLWGEGDNTFYGFYPAPTSSNGATMAANVVTGSIPKAYTATESAPGSKNYVADMTNHGYMYAVGTGTSSDGAVSLVFHPLMTAFEFDLRTLSGQPTSGKLTKVTLSYQTGTGSGSGTGTTPVEPSPYPGVPPPPPEPDPFPYMTTPYLAGDFTATLNADGTYSLTVTENDNRSQSIEVTIPDGGVLLSDDSDVRVTLLGLAMDQTSMNLVLTFDDGLTRTLPLKADLNNDGTVGSNEWITVLAGEKMHVRNANVPGEPGSWVYELEHSGTTVTLSDGTVVEEVVRDWDTSGATTTAPFDSYRTSDGGVTKEDVEVIFEYADADADGLPVRTGGEIAWTSTSPSTLSSVASEGSINKDFSASVTAYSSGVVQETVIKFLKHAENLKSRTAVGSSSSPYDLSMYDIHGASRSGRPVTANSYVVTRAGWYMFPLVYGNAIDYTKSEAPLYKNGVNAYAYKDAAVPEANENDNWHNFQNFTGTSLISTPYVLDDAGLATSDVEAVVVWQDVESADYSFIENVDVTDVPFSSNVFYDPKNSVDNPVYKTSVPYIKFQVPMGSIDSDETKDPLLRVTGIRQGNAVVAVRLKSAKTIGGTTYAAGTILWSWHIWITDGYDTDGDFKGDDLASIPVTSHPDYGGYTLNVMPVNLGWCDTGTKTYYKDRVWYVRVSQTSGSAEPLVFRVIQKKAPSSTSGSGTFYQWGRKDPFLPASGISTNKAAFSPAGYTLTSSTSHGECNSSYTRADNASMAIQNPFIFYAYDHSRYHWMRYPVCTYNLWNMAGGTSTGDIDVSKTVYDPCPPGYCVPRLGAFSGFVTTGRYGDTDDAGDCTMNVEDINGDGVISWVDSDLEWGWYFYTNSSKTQTIFFPFSGYRYAFSQVHHGSFGHYWYAAPRGKFGEEGISIHLFYMDVGSVSVSFSNTPIEPGFGASVRPVVE